MPASLYPANAKKLEFSTQEETTTERFEVKQYLLCSDCEQRFSKNGESPVLNLVAPKLVPKKPHEFPLLERIEAKEPFHAEPNLKAYSASTAGIDTEHFAYFALSLAWRSSITTWELPGGLRTTMIDLGTHQEPLRKYLRGEAPFPANIAVIITVCTDEETRRNWILPTRSPELGFETVVLSACGFILRVWMGPNLPEAVTRMCLHTSAYKTILVSDCEAATKRTMGYLKGTPTPES